MGWLYEGDFIGGKYEVWGPDVIYNGNYVRSDGSKGAYIIYYITSLRCCLSCIGYMVYKRIDGDIHILISLFT